MVKFIVMKKLFTLTALIAGVAFFAGCMNQPVEEGMIEETPVVVEDIVIEEEVVVEEVIEDEVMPEAIAE